MASKPTRLGINGGGRRKLTSWIESFVKHTDNLESAEVFRKWTAISVIAAALEQKVWMSTSDKLYPNLYTILVGHPGVGKTRTIMSGRKFLAELSDFFIAPTSMKMASLVDALLASKRTLIRLQSKEPPLEFHSMTLVMDEWTAFMHAWDDELVGGLTTFYDVGVPYEQHRRTRDVRIKIPRPQLSILAGTTPGNLTKFMPEAAWYQGFASRLILIFSDERSIGDDFAGPSRGLPPDMVHDLKAIASLQGEFKITEEFRALVTAWREAGEDPKPSHPKLLHYNTRRRAHIYKLAMVAAIDSGNSLVLTGDCFTTALRWLGEAEMAMPAIFEEGIIAADARSMDEIEDWIRRQGKPVPDYQIMHFMTKQVAHYAVVKMFELMAQTGRIKQVGMLAEKWGLWEVND